MLEEEEKVGIRELSEKRCLDMGWNNAKEITSWEIAYCIHTHGLSIDKVPSKRKEAVQKELAKLKSKYKKQKDEAENFKSIESILAIRNSDAMVHEFLVNGTTIIAPPDDKSDKIIDYIFDPHIFDNAESAKKAITIAKNLESYFSRMIMINGVRFKDLHPKDLKSVQATTLKLINVYERVGIPREETIKALQSINKKPNGTLKQEIDSWRAELSAYFVSLGNTKTNSDKIAKVITTHCELSIQTS